MATGPRMPGFVPCENQKDSKRRKKCQHEYNSSMQMIGVKVFEDWRSDERGTWGYEAQSQTFVHQPHSLWPSKYLRNHDCKRRLGWDVDDQLTKKAVTTDTIVRLLNSRRCLQYLWKHVCKRNPLNVQKRLDSWTSTIFKPLVTLTSGNTIMTYILVSVILTIS